MDLAPHELFAAMPPIVHRACVEGSTGKNSPCCFSAAFRCASTIPGCTTAVRSAAFTLRTARRCLVQSSTIARLTVCPHWLVPPPRGSTGTPPSRASASTACTSATVFGTTTASGCTW